MRDRLIELLKQKSCVYVPCDNECGGCKNVEMYDDSIESIADHLLAEGVIVPPLPVKVGDKVYRLMCRGFKDFFLREEAVWIVDLHATAGFEIITKYLDKNRCSYFPKIEKEDIGETIFLTKSEAERALAERRANNDS